MKNTVRVSYRLPIETANALEVESTRARRTKTAVLIIAIEEHILKCQEERAAESKKRVDTRKAR